MAEIVNARRGDHAKLEMTTVLVTEQETVR
jgi:hypothetical protein